jgi:hypothetical protein
MVMFQKTKEGTDEHEENGKGDVHYNPSFSGH